MTRSAEELILDVAERDLDEGIAHVRELMRERFKRAFWEKPIEAAVVGAIHTIQLRSRFREDVKVLCALAARVNAGEDAAALARDNLERVVHLRELGLVARVKEPAFQEILERDRAFFAERLPDLARLVAAGPAVDYPALVRQAWGAPERPREIVLGNTAHIQETIRALEKQPQLLRVPHSWIPRIAEIARDVVDWQTARVLAGIDRIYAV